MLELPVVAMDALVQHLQVRDEVTDGMARELGEGLGLLDRMAPDLVGAIGQNHAKLTQQAADPIDRGGALLDETLANARATHQEPLRSGTHAVPAVVC